MDLEETNQVGMQRNANDALEFSHGRNLLPGNAALDAFDGTLYRRNQKRETRESNRTERRKEDPSVTHSEYINTFRNKEGFTFSFVSFLTARKTFPKEPSPICSPIV
jgi:hypothetical protein